MKCRHWVLAWLPAIGLAQAPSEPAPAPAPTRCTASEHRQFDFWVGLWTVIDAEGKFAGVNRIEALDAGCVLQERWTSARGAYSGTSLNWFGSDRRWHQTWIDSMGQSLQLVGGLVDGKMILEGAPKQRITWTPVDGNTVRQLWEMSANEGKTWAVAFDGLYRRVMQAPPADETRAGETPLLARLAGDWIGSGEVMQAQVAVTLHVGPALAGRFTELHWMNLGGGAASQLFEGRAIYERQPDGRYRATWRDSQGSEHPIIASEQGTTLEALWGESGRTQYALQASGELEVIDSVKRKDGTWQEFGRTRLKRAN